PRCRPGCACRGGNKPKSLDQIAKYEENGPASRCCADRGRGRSWTSPSCSSWSRRPSTFRTGTPAVRLGATAPAAITGAASPAAIIGDVAPPATTDGAVSVDRAACRRWCPLILQLPTTPRRPAHQPPGRCSPPENCSPPVTE